MADAECRWGEAFCRKWLHWDKYPTRSGVSVGQQSDAITSPVTRFRQSPPSRKQLKTEVLPRDYLSEREIGPIIRACNKNTVFESAF